MSSSQSRAPRRLVLFHGLASTPKEFALIAHPLRRLAVALETPTVPGYSHGSVASSSNWREWVDAAADCIDVVAARSNDPFVVGGLCTGAMLAIAAVAQRRPPGVQGLVLLSPLFSYDGWGLPWWYRLRLIAYTLGIERWFSMRERMPFGLKSERLRQWVRKQLETEEASLVGPPRVSLQLVHESERLSRHVLTCLPGLSLPMLALHARDDEICQLRNVQQALAFVPAPGCPLRILENSYHLITADNDRQQVADELAGFLQSVAFSNADLSLDDDALAAAPRDSMAGGLA